MSSTARVASRSSLVLIAALVLAETVSAFETTMAVQLLYANNPFFHGPITQLTWIVTAYLLVAAASTGVCGRLGDQFGRTRVLTWVLVISAAGSVISAVAPNVEVLILGRGVQGVSGAVLPLAIGLAREVLPQARVATGIAVISASALIAGAGGLLLAGLMIDHTDWRLIFLSAVVLALLAVVAIRALIPPSRASLADPGKVDYVGAVLFSAGVATALFGVTKSAQWHWIDSRTLSFVLAGLAILAVWVGWELRAPHPMIDLRRFGNPKFALGILGTAIIAFGVFGLSQVLPTAIMRTPKEIPLPGGGVLDLPVGLGLTATMAGLVGALGSAVGFGISPWPGRISRRFGAARTVMIGTVVAFAAFAALPYLFSTVPTYLLYTIGAAVGTTFCYGALPTLIVECVPEDETSAAVGMQAVVRTAFQGVASSFAGLFLARDQVHLGKVAFLSETGLRTTVYVALGACVAGFAVALLAARYRSSTLREPEPEPAAAAQGLAATA